MTNSELWQDLEAQFRTLDPYGLLRADGIYTLGSSNVSGEFLYEWALKGETSLAARFRILAHRAGVALGRTDLAPSVAWLQDLTTEPRFFKIETPVGVEQRADGTIVRHFVVATINDICQASAHHCVSLQLAALEAEHFANSAPPTQALSNRLTVPLEVPPMDPEATSALPESEISQATVVEPSDADRGKIRSSWLDVKRSAKGWNSDLDIENNGGPTYNTIQRYRSGKKSTRDPYVRGLFAKVFGRDISEVPE